MKDYEKVSNDKNLKLQNIKRFSHPWCNVLDIGQIATNDLNHVCLFGQKTPNIAMQGYNNSLDYTGYDQTL